MTYDKTPPLCARAVAFALVFPSGKKLLMEQTPVEHRLYRGEWAVPSGRIEDGESPLQAMVREMKEETGCEPVTYVALPLVDCTASGANTPFLVQPFAVTAWKGLPLPWNDAGQPLEWRRVSQALSSPIPQVRMMAAAAIIL